MVKRNMLNNEDGLISIDAVIGITVFMTSVIAVMMFSLFAQMQSTIQYALGQTAKEVSGYFYMLDKTGLTKVASGKNKEGAGKDIDKTINDVFTFSSRAGNAVDHGKALVESVQNYQDIDLKEVNDLKDLTESDIKELKGYSEIFKDDLNTLSSDPMGQLKQIFTIFAKSMINKGMSYYVAPLVCKSLMPKYLGGDRETANEELIRMGIENGLDGLDFSQSELLADGRSIKLVVMYRVNPEYMTLGFVKLPGKSGIAVRQVACTAAWVNPDNENTVKLSALIQKQEDTALQEGNDGNQ